MSPANPKIEAYLDRIARPLERTLDRQALDEVRMEARFHLESLVAREVAGGRSEAEAVAAALAEYGSPDVAGQGVLDEWCRGRQALTFARASSAAFWWSFAHFGLAFGLTLLWLEYAAMWPGSWRSDVEVDAAVLSFVAPLAAGIATGWRVPTGNLRALFLVFLPLIPYTAFAGWLTSPFLAPDLIPGLLFTSATLGALAVSVTAWFRRHGRPSGPLKALS